MSAIITTVCLTCLKRKLKVEKSSRKCANVPTKKEVRRSRKSRRDAVARNFNECFILLVIFFSSPAVPWFYFFWSFGAYFEKYVFAIHRKATDSFICDTQKEVWWRRIEAKCVENAVYRENILSLH